MPDYAIFDPASPTVANRVTRFVRSFPEEREGDLGLNVLKNPSVSGIDLRNCKVSGGVLVNLTAQELSAIQAAQAASALADEKASLSLSNTRAQQRLIIESLAVVMLSEINALRAAVVPALTPRTLSQMRNAILTEYQSRVDALS